VQDSKFDPLMTELGQTRSCGDVGSMSGLPESGHGCPGGYEWFVTLVVLVCLYFAVRNFMRSRR
jgi:hypothetical protein